MDMQGKHGDKEERVRVRLLCSYTKDICNWSRIVNNKDQLFCSNMYRCMCEKGGTYITITFIDWETMKSVTSFYASITLAFAVLKMIINVSKTPLRSEHCNATFAQVEEEKEEGQEEKEREEEEEEEQQQHNNKKKKTTETLLMQTIYIHI